MDTAASSSFQFQRGSGGGYAIPINKAVVRRAAGGSRDGLGHPPHRADGIPRRPGHRRRRSGGAQIASAVPNGPAAQAGLSAGDTITSVDGHTITSPADLTRLMLTEQPGASVEVEYLDTSGTQQSTTVQLGSGPPQ